MQESYQPNLHLQTTLGDNEPIITLPTHQLQPMSLAYSHFYKQRQIYNETPYINFPHPPSCSLPSPSYSFTSDATGYACMDNSNCFSCPQLINSELTCESSPITPTFESLVYPSEYPFQANLYQFSQPSPHIPVSFPSNFVSHYPLPVASTSVSQAPKPAPKKRRPRASKLASKGEPVNLSCPRLDCTKIFKRAEHLKRHLNSVHSPVKMFPCTFPQCVKAFSRSDNLNQHLRTHMRKLAQAQLRLQR